MKRSYYITTAIPYVNAAPHVGFALEIIQTDVLARYHRLLGDDTYFLTGTDENALKNVQAAEKLGIPTQELVDKNSKRFHQLKQALNLSFDDFIRTTEPRHVTQAQALWQTCRKEDIYKKSYKGFYCVGCEAFYTEKDLVDGKCPEHQVVLEVVEEENYFFRLSSYQKWLDDLITKDKLKIIPEIRKNEVLAFIRQGLADFSISRSKERAHGWGIPVPGDPIQIIYVWFDALANYITALDWQDNGELFLKYWPADVHVIGKGITRFHAIYWPAMLKSAGIEIPKSLFVHGYITVEGHKISKSLGNVIDPFEMVKKYGTDAVRYYLLREIPSYGDGDFSEERFVELYNADLANGLGNLVARVAKLAQTSGITYHFRQDLTKRRPGREVQEALDRFRFDEALAIIRNKIAACDKVIDRHKPWQLKGREQEAVLTPLILEIKNIASNLLPFLPETAAKIHAQFDQTPIESQPPLFPRLEKPVSFSPKTPNSPKPQTDNIVVGKIAQLAPHPNADALQIAKVDVGGKKLEIVCGAKNLKIGQMVPVALPGASVKQPGGKMLKVKATNLRGARSEGMLLSGLELGVNENHSEIYILPTDLKSKTGEPLEISELGG